MRKTDFPNLCHEDLFVACAKKIRNRVVRENLLSHQEEVDELHGEYVDAAEGSQLYSFPSVDGFWDTPTKDWNNLYKNHMARSSGVAWDEYNAIKLAPAGNICPYCSVQTIRTVDHFLPKSHLPQYSIMPVNLVAACRSCNTEKDAVHGDTLEEQLFHPYFESVQGRWLKANLQEVTPPAVSFKVDPRHGLDATTAARAEYQFETLGLGLVYASTAANELASIEWELKNIHIENEDSAEIRQHLKTQADSASFSPYPVEWKVALYEELSQSEWFCSGGFRFS